MPEPTLSIHCHLDIKLIAIIVHLMESAGVDHNSMYSSVPTWSAERIGGLSEWQPTVDEAVTFLRSRDFTMKQLKTRGIGIKKALEADDLSATTGKTKEIRKILDSLSPGK